MTRLEHLKKLPLQKRLQAMENTRRQLSEGQRLFSALNYEPLFSSKILSGLFLFYEVRQKESYWWCIQEKYFG